jgi:hypothetical protein
MKIKNIRYYDETKLAFEAMGITFYIKEPKDVILVGVDEELAGNWIKKRYGFLLNCLDNRNIKVMI